MSNINEFMSNIFDLLTDTFGASLGPGTYLQIGWPGISLNSVDFKPLDSPYGSYDPNRAEETFSLISNIAPTCNPLRFENSGFEIDDLYQIIINEAIPQGANPANLSANPAYKSFSDAQYEFVNAQKGATHDPNLFFYPCRATPTDWYTEDAAKLWPTLSLTSAQTKPTKPDSPFFKLGGKELLDKGIWKIPPVVTSSSQIKKRKNIYIMNHTVNQPVLTGRNSSVIRRHTELSLSIVTAFPAAPVPVVIKPKNLFNKLDLLKNIDFDIKNTI